ncbi:MAG: bifunctional riboflavin kinase/FAD synthetase [Planctomycetes bacterium]|nr:bifunctional riboflavin kinase/FAD synthetase [Planctomycetota bacterium]
MDNRLITGLDDIPAELRGCILTIGNFDGVHRGHRRILDVAHKLSGAAGRPLVVVMTFEPAPEQLLHPGKDACRLTTLDQKVSLLLGAGADRVVVADTDATLLQMSWETFIDQIVCAKFAPSHIVEGRNFYFGHDRSGDVDLLRRVGARAGFEVHVIESLSVDVAGGNATVSSTLIRRFVLAGEINRANLCLGGKYSVSGIVAASAGRGRQMGFPTANLTSVKQLVPADGIYAGTAEVQGRSYAAAISIGDNPTFDAGERTVEAFLLDAAGDFYEESMTLSFAERLRDQRRFSGSDELKAQIAKDVERVREICK